MKPESQEESADAIAERVRSHEQSVAQRQALHVETWGDDGAPYFSEGSFEFWQALAQGRFCLGKCSACGHVYFPPRVICPSCWVPDAVELADTPGYGRLVSYTDVHVVAENLRPLVPLRIAIVDMEEGVRMLTWLMDTGDTEVEPGSRCRIVVKTVLDRQRFVAQLAPGEAP